MFLILALSFWPIFTVFVSFQCEKNIVHNFQIDKFVIEKLDNFVIESLKKENSI